MCSSVKSGKGGRQRVGRVECERVSRVRVADCGLGAIIKAKSTHER